MSHQKTYSQRLLERTSRTFALSIPRLPRPTRREVEVAYLLFRIADTFEDSARWSRHQRTRALAAFCDLLAEPSPLKARLLAVRWAASAPIAHRGYQELIAEAPSVLAAFRELRPAARELIRDHAARTARGMAAFVARTGGDGRLLLTDLEDLRGYCYVVAGIVGEMLTELFLLGRAELLPIAADLRARSRSFGEGLQLVNILKDSAFDHDQGRSYLPPEVGRDEIFALARSDLEASAEYVLALQGVGAERGLVAFNAINVLLAFATLDRVEAEGPGAKISRSEVFALFERMERDLARGRPVVPRSAGLGSERAPAAATVAGVASRSPEIFSALSSR